jgi:hypothetical protein
MDLSISLVLNAKRCPNELYGSLWTFIPHNDKPVMPSRKEIQEQKFELYAKKIILAAGLKPERRQKMLNYAGSYTNVLKMVAQMVADPIYLHKIRQMDIIRVGPYVQLRSIVEGIENRL